MISNHVSKLKRESLYKYSKMIERVDPRVRSQEQQFLHECAWDLLLDVINSKSNVNMGTDRILARHKKSLNKLGLLPGKHKYHTYNVLRQYLRCSDGSGYSVLMSTLNRRGLLPRLELGQK